MFSPTGLAADYEFVIWLSGKAQGALPRVAPVSTTDTVSSVPSTRLPKDITMNTKTLIASALVLAFAGTGAAFAQEGTQDFPAPQWTSASRAEVAAALKAAPAAVIGTEASAAPQPASTLSRAQVAAETREATRLGALGADEGSVRTATPAQLELIRAAGLRALDTHLAQSAR
jgi:hypothetical protein